MYDIVLAHAVTMVSTKCTSSDLVCYAEHSI